MTSLVHITETALLLLVAYLAGCILGYAVRLVLHAGRGTRQVAPPATPVVAPASEPELRKPRSSAARLAASVEPLPLATPVSPVEMVKAGRGPLPAPAPPTAAGPTHSRPESLAEPRSGGPDNLKQIKGIGPKIEASLHAMGIFHFDQIAGWNKTDIAWVETRLSFKGRIGRERWVAQALQLSQQKTDA